MECKFLKIGRTLKKTGLFSTFDPEIQTFLTSRLELGQDEQPVIAFFDDAERWFLATSRRIIWPKKRKIHHTWYRAINKMGATYGPQGLQPCEHDLRTKKSNGKPFCKLCLAGSPWFYVTTSLGRRHEFPIEPGTSFDIWDCFHLMSVLEKIHPRKLTLR